MILGDMKALRIAIILPLLTARTGPQRFVAEISRALELRGHEVYVFSLLYSPKATFEELKQRNVKEITSSRVIKRVVGKILEAFQRKYGKLSIYLSGVPLSVFVSPILAFYAALKVKPDVMVVNSGHTFMCILKLLFRKVKIILCYHGGAFSTMNHNLIANLLNIFEKVSARTCIPIVNSRSAADLMIKRLGVSPYVVYFGVDDKFYMVPRKDDGRTLLYVGRISPYRRQDFLIRLMPKILRSIKNAKLILIGSLSESDKSYYGELLKLINRYKLHDSVKIIVNANDTELLEAYSKASIYVNPSYEALGTNIIEAMATGLPVIVVKGGANAEVVIHGETGFIIEDDPEKWAEYILMLLTDHVLREKLSKNAKAWSLRFSWKETVNKILTLISY